MTPKQLLNKIKLMELEAPLTKKFEKELNDVGRWNYEREIKKYINQKEHWLGWLSGYNGPGFYKRKNWNNITAQSIYNRISCPPMLLWLCEVSGVERSKILSAKRKAIEANSAYPSMCSAIRKIIPWELIQERLI